MNRHDDAEQQVRTWLQDEAQGELPDWVLEQTFATTRSMRQRQGPLGWLRSTGNRASSTTRWRSNMFTLATVTAAAAAVILAVNVVVNDLQPLAPGADAPTITVEEKTFIGHAAFGPGCPDEGGDGDWECYDLAGVSFDDPRLQGSVRMLANSTYMDDGVYRNQFIITTDDGKWVGDPVPGIMADASRGAPSVHLLKGEGAYDGLYAVAAVELNGGQFRFEGHIVHGGFPELPAG